MKLLRPLTTTLTSIALLSATALAGSDQKAEAPLVRPAGAPDGDAKGKVRVEHDSEKNRDKMKVEAEQIDTSSTFELWVADIVGTLTFIGVMPIDGPGEVEIELDTKEGPPLPFAATNVAELAGRSLEVRSAGATYLTGTIPQIGSGGGGSGGSGGSGGGGDWIKVISPLVRPGGAPDANAKGKVEVRRRDEDQRQKFKVEAENIDPSLGFSTWLETAVGSGTLQNIGAMPKDGFDEVELELDTGDGDALPLGVADLDELAGRVVEVRDSAGNVYLTGIVPSLSAAGSAPVKTKTTLNATVGEGRLRLRSKPAKGKQEFELRIKKLAAKSMVDVWMRGPGAGAFALVTTMKTSGGGGATFSVKTKKGQTLPLAAASLQALSGADIEVRDTTTGQLLQSGTVPAL